MVDLPAAFDVTVDAAARLVRTLDGAQEARPGRLALVQAYLCSTPRGLGEEHVLNRIIDICDEGATLFCALASVPMFSFAHTQRLQAEYFECMQKAGLLAHRNLVYSDGNGWAGRGSRGSCQWELPANPTETLIDVCREAREAIEAFRWVFVNSPRTFMVDGYYGRAYQYLTREYTHEEKPVPYIPPQK